MPKNMLTEQIDPWYWSHQRQIGEAAKKWMDGDYMALRTILASRFEAGARWNLRETAAMSPYISRFLEMCILLGPSE